MCLQEDETIRPSMSEVVTALEYLIIGKEPEEEEKEEEEKEKGKDS